MESGYPGTSETNPRAQARPFPSKNLPSPRLGLLGFRNKDLSKPSKSRSFMKGSFGPLCLIVCFWTSSSSSCCCWFFYNADERLIPQRGRSFSVAKTKLYCKRMQMHHSPTSVAPQQRSEKDCFDDRCSLRCQNWPRTHRGKAVLFLLTPATMLMFIAHIDPWWPNNLWRPFSFMSDFQQEIKCLFDS